MTADKKEKMIVKFTAIKIRDMVSEDGRFRYVKAMDRVIEDIFGYRNFASRVKASRTESEVTYVFRSFGWSNLMIFRISTLADALEDLLRIDMDIRRLKKRMNSEYGNKKPGAKDEAKAYSKLKKLYTKTVRAICKEMHLNTKESRRYRDSYKAAKHLVDHDLDWDDDYFWSSADDDDDYFFDNSRKVDYFEEYMKNKQPKRRSERYQRSYDPLLEEDDDDEDDTDELEDPDKVLDDFLRESRAHSAMREYAYCPPKRATKPNDFDSTISSKLDAMISGLNTLTATIQAAQASQYLAAKPQQPTAYKSPVWIPEPGTLKKKHVRKSDMFSPPPGYYYSPAPKQRVVEEEPDDEPPELTKEQLIDEINRSNPRQTSTALEEAESTNSDDNNEAKEES